MKSTVRCVALLLLSCALPAMAGALDECMAKGDSGAVMICLQQEETATEASLRQAEAVVARKVHDLETVARNAEPRAAYDRAAVAFKQYRDAQCGFVKSMYGSGAGAGQAQVACRIDITRRRIRELQ